MPISAVVAVLIAALLHAAWNLVVKSSGDRLVAATSQVVLAALVSLPFVIVRGLPTGAASFLIGSSVVQVVYLYALATAYNHADLSFVYPIARGSAPVLIAISALAGLSEPIAGRGWLALALICGGVVGMGLAARSRRGLGWSLLTGLLIATYITIDGRGVTRVDDVIAYTGTLYCATSMLLIPVVLATRGWRQVQETMTREWSRHLFAGTAGVGSYGLLLYASRLAPLSLVAAARETAVVFAALGGWWFLGERVGRVRVLAVAAIAAGVMVMAINR
ncbi:MAG: EamA family transporter [Acidimicrobiia bacterium]